MRKLGTALLVIMGIYAIVMSLNSLDGDTLVSLGYAKNAYLLLNLAPTIGLVALGGGLIWQRERLAARWFADVPLNVSRQGEQLVRVALIFLGLLFTTIAVSELLIMPFLASYRWFFVDRTYIAAPDFWETFVFPFAAPAVQLGAGVLFIKQSSLISSRIWRAGESVHSGTRATGPACPSCGTPYDPIDYRSGVSASCFTCHEPLDLSADAWIEAADSLEEAGQYERALEQYDSALEQYPKNGDIWNNRGIILDELDRREEALESYKRSLELKPRDADVWFNVARSQEEQGLFEEAMASYRKALEVDPLHSDTLYAKAELEKKTRD
jgi:hypothetical protein